MEQLGLRTISEYFEVLSRTATKRKLYRGHASMSWSLTPAAFRPGVAGLDTRTKLYAWKRAAARFAIPTPSNEVEWLVLTQHYGVPTPLLDWSTSPLVALFFACLGEPDQSGCVWQADERSTFMVVNDFFSIDLFKRFRPGAPFLIPAIGMNARTVAQDSFMSLHAKAMKNEPWVEARQIFIVDPPRKAETLSALGILGFTKERLFSDISIAVEVFRESL